MTIPTSNILVAMVKGTSRQINIEVRDEAGNPFDMTGGAAVFWVGKSVCSVGADVIIMKDSPTITEDGGLWTIGVRIDPEDTEDFPSRASYYCECRVWDQSNNEYVVAAGGFEIDPSLTLSAAHP